MSDPSASQSMVQQPAVLTLSFPPTTGLSASVAVMVETFLRELAADRAVRDVAVLTVRELLENIADHSGGAVGFLLIGVQTTKSGHRVQVKTRNPATEAQYERARDAIAAPLENGSAISGLGRIRHEQSLALELEFDGHELEFRVQV